MPKSHSHEKGHAHEIETRQKLAAEAVHKALGETNRKHSQAAIMHSQQRERELASFKDSEKSKQLKDNHVGLQFLLDGFVAAMTPIAPAISQIIKVQRNVLNNKQISSLVDIGETFAKLPFCIANPNRSMKQNLDMFLGGMKKLTQFATENPEIIIGVATILFPALAPVSIFLSKALGLLAALAPALKDPLQRAIHSAKKEVDLTESVIRDASKYAEKSHYRAKPKASKTDNTQGRM